MTKVQTKDGQHVAPPPPWGRPHDANALAPRCAELRVLAASLARLPILPGARGALASEFVRRGLAAQEVLARAALVLEEPGEGALRTFPAAPGPRRRDEAAGGAGGEGLLGGLGELWAEFVPGGSGRGFLELDRHRLDAMRIAVERRVSQGAGPGRDPASPPSGGGADDFAQTNRVGPLLDILIAWLNAPGMDRMEPAVRAALVHYHLLALRPFSRGCAVVARLAEAMVLDAAGYRFAPAVLGEYYLSHLGEYETRAPLHPTCAEGNIQASDQTDLKAWPGAGTCPDDPTPFVDFCLRGLAWGLREAEERIAEGLRRLVLERHFEELRLSRRLTARQHALLRILLDGGHGPVGIRALCRASPFSLLYGRASEQTARRDLKRLSRLGLLASLEDGFVLNRRALCG